MNKRKLLFFSITALGISSIITQLIAMREFLNVFSGNELVFGIIIANWLLLTGLGSYLGRHIDKIKAKLGLLVVSQIIIAILPFFNIFFIRILRELVFKPGETIGVAGVFFSTFVVLLPYCIISGMLLTLACVVYARREDSKSIGEVYFIDNIGDIIGGALFSFLLIYFLNPFQMAFFIMALNLLAAFLVLRFIDKRVFSCLVIGVFVFLSVLFLRYDFDKITTGMQYKNQEVLFNKNSLYGNIVVTKTQEQLNFYENGIILFTTEDAVSNEEAVHYAMAQNDNPKNILLISGGVAGTLNEILKYNISRIDYVELDPLIIDLGKKYTDSLDNEKINIIKKDGRLFVKQTKQKYDAVIVDLPDPTNAQINRFYTLEFFYELKRILNEGGVVSLSLTSSENYMSEEIIKLNSALYKTLNKVFKNVIVVPGGRNFFIASDSGLSYDIAPLIDEKNIDNEYVNEDYLKGIITQDRVNNVLASVKEKVNLNKDFTPVSSYYNLQLWLSYFKTNYLLFLSIVIIFTVIYLLRLRDVPLAIFTTGFAASSLEIAILIAFQALYGFVYHQIGIIVTAFMIGLAFGSFTINKNINKIKKEHLVLIEFSIFVFALLLPLLLFLFSKIENAFIPSFIIIPILTMIIGALTGAEFPIASKVHFKRVSDTAASLYSADLFGAAIGALLVSSLLIPLLGIVKVCVVVGVLNLITGIIVLKTKK